MQLGSRPLSAYDSLPCAVSMRKNPRGSPGTFCADRLAMSVAFGVRLFEETLDPAAIQCSQRVSCPPRHSKKLDEIRSIVLLAVLL